jgi:hypothetical protein
MKKVIRLTESELTTLIERIINETDKESILKKVIQGRQNKTTRDYDDLDFSDDEDSDFPEYEDDDESEDENEY